ncbi:MAG: ferredoxin [Paucimonas sp.]|nr:ferredoxin [Paucimonas sp.]
MAWQKVAREDALDTEYPTPVSVGEKMIALYKVEGQVFGTSNVCTHQFALLSEGYIDGDCIECPLHQALFHIPTGKLQSGPTCDDLKTYPVKIENGDVFVDCD